MREAELNRQRVVFTPQEAARLPQDRPYAAYICHYDWAEGEHATLMHCHERLAEVLLILKGSGRYTVDLRRYEVAAGDVVLCSGGALHDEFPQADQPYQTLCVAIGNLALADLPPYSLLSPDRCPLFHQPEQFADLKELFCLMDRYAAEREPGFQELCQHLMLASLELVRRMAAGRKEDLVTREDSTFGRVARYIDRHYAEDLSIEQLARQFYLSPYHLSHIFRQKTGYSLKQYVLRRRIGDAQMRLVNAQDSVHHLRGGGIRGRQLLLTHLFKIRRPHAHGVPEIPDRAVRPQKSPEKRPAEGTVPFPPQVCLFHSVRYICILCPAS